MRLPNETPKRNAFSSFRSDVSLLRGSTTAAVEPAAIMRASTLLKKYQDATREMARLETVLAALRTQLLAVAAKPALRKRRRTHAESAALVRDVVKVFRDANQVLPPREVAYRLGLPLWAANQRIAQAVKLRLVEKVGPARYRASHVVPAFTTGGSRDERT